MKSHVISASATLYESLHQMNRNKVKYLVAVDTAGHVLGTLTDGDVRRGLLSGMNLQDPITSAYNSAFKSVQISDGLREVLSEFKDSRIEFLPVIDKERRLRNVITRRGLQVLLLQNQKFNIEFDFNSLDENTFEHEIFARPWGFYKTTVLNQLYQSKVIYIMPGHALSLQSHRRREEYWIIVNGTGVIRLGDSEHPVVPGGTYYIPTGCMHRLTNTSKTETLILVEVQLGDYFGEDDIYRYEDRYGRMI